MGIQRTVSRLAALTSVASASTFSKSSFSKTTRLPARSPPACSLVCPGQHTTALRPKAWKPSQMTARNLAEHLASRLVAQSFDGLHGGGAAGGIERREQRRRPQQREGQQTRLQRRQEAGEIRIGRQAAEGHLVDQPAEAAGDA